MFDGATFIDLAIDGYVMPDEIDDYVDRWHESDGNMELHTFLGMTVQEYSLFVEQPDGISIIIAARKYNIPLLEAVNDNILQADRLAARADGGLAIAALKRWIAAQPDR